MQEDSRAGLAPVPRLVSGKPAHRPAIVGDMPFQTGVLAKNSISVRFALAACFLLSAASGLQAQQIAFTMDDLPAHGPLPPHTTRTEVADAVLHALAEAGLPPTYGFVNGVRDQEEPADVEVLDLWRKHGNLLGNHAWSHMDLNKNTAAAFEEDVARNEPLLASKMEGADWHWLRYPYLSEGDTPEKKTEVRSYLAAHHYKVAAVTMSFGDYLWNDPYARCMAKRDNAAIAFLEVSYLQAARAEAEFELAASQQVYGRSIPFVLLMHIGAFDARMLPRLLAQYKDLGFSFVSLDTAEQDAFYAGDLNPSEPAGPSNLQSAARGKGLTLPSVPPPPPADLNKVCR